MDRRDLTRRVQFLEDQDALIREYFYWVPPVYGVPVGEEVSPKEAEIERHIAEKYPERGPPMWSCGGWLPKPDADEENYQKQTKRDSGRKRPLESISGNSSKRPKLSPVSSVSFSVGYEDPVQTSQYIREPIARVIQSVKLLCGNNGVLIDEFISHYIVQTGISNIINDVLRMLDRNFLDLLELSQSERANAASEILESLDIESTSKCVYLDHVKVPEKAGLWNSVRHAFPEGTVEEAQEHEMMYVGSAASEESGTRARVMRQHENKDYRNTHPSLLYSAMDEPGAMHSWFRVALVQNSESRAAIRITESVAIACLHTYTSSVYTEMLRRYGLVEPSSVAFGLIRTGAMKDGIHSGRSFTDSAEQRVLHQKLLESYGGLAWTFETMPEVVQRWLSAENFDRATVLDLAETQSLSLANAIHREMSKKGGAVSATGRRELMIQHALAGGLFNVKTYDNKGRPFSEINFMNHKLSLPQSLIRERNIKPDS